jgi:hypothetical protein
MSASDLVGCAQEIGDPGKFLDREALGERRFGLESVEHAGDRAGGEPRRGGQLAGAEPAVVFDDV